MNQSDFHIRYATTADLPVFLDLFRNVISGLSDYYNDTAIKGEIKRINLEYLTSQIGQNSKTLLLAFLEKTPVGFCIIQDQTGPIWIEWYGVQESARKHGVGKALLQHLISDASQNPTATKLWCGTRINNDISSSLLEQTGFQRLCKVNNHWYGQDFYLWERMLKKV